MQVGRHLHETYDYVPDWAQMLCVVEEAGEFAGAYRRYTDHARRPGSFQEVSDEWADLVIAAFGMAARLGIDADAALAAKWEVITTRGYRDPR